MKFTTIFLQSFFQLFYRIAIIIILNAVSFFIDYYTPLHFAAEKGHLNIIQLLLQQKGIDYNQRTIFP